MVKSIEKNRDFRFIKKKDNGATGKMEEAVSR